MGHHGLPAAPCPCPTSRPLSGAAQNTVSMSPLHAPHKFISPCPHHPLLHPLLDSPKCVHLPHESPLPGTVPTVPHPCPSSCIPNVQPPPQLMLQVGWKPLSPKDGDGRVDAAHAPVSGDLLRQAEVTHYSRVATGLAAHQAVLGAQQDPCHTDHTSTPSPDTAPRTAWHSAASCSPAGHAWASNVGMGQREQWDALEHPVPWR